MVKHFPYARKNYSSNMLKKRVISTAGMGGLCVWQCGLFLLGKWHGKNWNTGKTGEHETLEQENFHFMRILCRHEMNEENVHEMNGNGWQWRSVRENDGLCFSIYGFPYGERQGKLVLLFWASAFLPFTRLWASWHFLSEVMSSACETKWKGTLGKRRSLN